MPRTTQVLSISVPPKFLKEIEKFAKKRHQNKSEFIRQAILDLIEEEQYRTRAMKIYKATRGKKTYTLKELEKELEV